MAKVTRKELLEMMQKNIAKMKEAHTNHDIDFYYDRCLELYEQCEVVRAAYVINKYACHKTDAFQVKPIINPNIIEEDTTFKKVKGGYVLPVYTINCFNYEDEHFPGIYFNGDIKFDPKYGKLHFVKCGGGNDVAKRLGQYPTYNPMFYHQYTSCRMENWTAGETLVQAFLAKYAIGAPERSKEWFIVDEETYYKMCELFSNPTLFKQIATGKRATL